MIPSARALKVGILSLSVFDQPGTSDHRARSKRSSPVFAESSRIGICSVGLMLYAASQSGDHSSGRRPVRSTNSVMLSLTLSAERSIPGRTIRRTLT